MPRCTHVEWTVQGNVGRVRSQPFSFRLLTPDTHLELRVTNSNSAAGSAYCSPPPGDSAQNQEASGGKGCTPTQCIRQTKRLSLLESCCCSDSPLACPEMEELGSVHPRTFVEHLLRARHCAELFTSIISVKPLKYPLGCVSVLRFMKEERGA